MIIMLRWLILTGSIILASYMLDGIRVAGFWSAFFAAAALGVINALLRPLILLLTLPINIMTLGLFTFVINAIMLSLVSVIIPGFEVIGFGSAFLGALIITAVNWFLNLLMTPKAEKQARVDVIDLKRKDGDRWE
ncbi:MAG: phage holin family protein [Smithellaceae bacterium]|nr:phage holin family protein [Smithellaceae bacterium]